MNEEMRRRIVYGIATLEDFARLDPEDVLQTKLTASALHTWIPPTLMTAAKKPSTDLGPRIYEHWASVQAVNEVRDLILQKGWDLSRMSRKKNGSIPLLYAHHDVDLPIGIVLSGRREMHPAGMEGLVLRNRVHDRELYADGDPMGPRVDSINNMMAAGFMPGSSVGWVPKEARLPNDEERERYPELGPFSIVFVQSTLVEDSITPIPKDSWANMRASLDAFVQRGSLTAECVGNACEALCGDVNDWIDRRERARTGHVQALVAGLPANASTHGGVLPAARASCGCGSSTTNDVRTELAAIRTELGGKIESLSLDLAAVRSHVSAQPRQAEPGTTVVSASAETVRKGESGRSQDPRGFHTRVLASVASHLSRTS